MATSPQPSNLTLSYLYRHLLDPAGGGGGDAGEVYMQTFEGVTGQILTITQNGGFLPIDNEKIILWGPTGPIIQGAAPGQYAINRTAVPNTLELVSAPPGPINLAVIFQP